MSELDEFTAALNAGDEQPSAAQQE